METSGRVEVTTDVALQRASAVGRVAGTSVVVKERERSVGRVTGAGGIEKKRCGTGSCVLVRSVESERSSANPRVIAGGAICEQRIPTNPRVTRASGKIFKGV